MRSCKKLDDPTVNNRLLGQTICHRPTIYKELEEPTVNNRPEEPAATGVAGWRMRGVGDGGGDELLWLAKFCTNPVEVGV